MPNRRHFIALGSGALASLVMGTTDSRRSSMHEVRFSVGHDIHETARRSGVPEFRVQDVAGLLMYHVSGVPEDVVFRFDHPGQEVSWHPVATFGMYADRRLGHKVHATTLQLSPRAFAAAPAGSEEEHRLAKAYIEGTIAQFQQGQWQRHATPGTDVMFTGRSSYLDEDGNVNPQATRAPDPAYEVPWEDWPAFVKGRPAWRWTGTGVLATLSVVYLCAARSDDVSPYDISLEFELLDHRIRRDAESLAKRLQDGDAKGWNSSARHETWQQERRDRIERLIHNALKRGDAVVPFPENQ
ncbi:hypothetical protein C1702_13630 [Caldimonas thermodepolymerans]|uniref:Uncharacterized protein n=2 Tax=Caldimonas thermodepolymerans TaxID=215580 RepID=A0A2S5T2A8_9BURK|nr:hypothetical protein C1702_13630 [Caldimonas thermodepolymerans]